MNGLLINAHEEAAPEERRDLALLARLAPFMKPYAWLFVGALTLMPVASIAGLLQPLLIKKAIDATIVRDHAEVRNVVAIFAVVIVFEFLTRFAQTYLTQLAGQRTTAGLRATVFGHIQKLSIRYFDRTPVGRIVTRVTNDIDNLTELFASGAVTAVTDIITLIGIVIFMVSIDWQLSLVAFAALPPLALAVNLFRRLARKAFRDIRFRVAQLNAYLAEQVQGIQVVQAYSREKECAEEYGTINGAYREANYQAIRYDALLYSVVQSVSVACVALVLYFSAVRAGWLAQENHPELWVGTVVAFYDYIQRFFVPIRDLATKYTIIQSSLAAAERVFSLLDNDEYDAPNRKGEVQSAQGESEYILQFENINFAYREGTPVLSDINFGIRPGEHIAIVGATGSGKSTLMSLLLRLHELQEGIIRVLGKDIRLYDSHTLRRKFSIVPQDVFFFSGTLRDNFVLGDVDIDDTRIWEALDRVGARSLVERRGGLRASVEERGQNFSAGERQLLAFARAICRDSELLLLDEATANVDSETEAQLQRASEEVLRNRTALIIAHRLSTIERADRILVLHRGELVEQGTHAELLEQGGIYARLHKLQKAEAA